MKLNSVTAEDLEPFKGRLPGSWGCCKLQQSQACRKHYSVNDSLLTCPRRWYWTFHMEESVLRPRLSQTLSRTWGRHQNMCVSQSRSSVQTDAGLCWRSLKRRSQSGWFVQFPQWRAVCFSGKWCSSSAGWVSGAGWHQTAGNVGRGIEMRSCRKPSQYGQLGLSCHRPPLCRHTEPWSDSRTESRRCPYSSWL